MNIKHDNASEQDREIARRFSRMRQADAVHLPVFPDEEALAGRSPVLVKIPLHSTLPKIATAAAVVVFAGVLMTNLSRQDPGVLYANIMNASSMETDQLMSVSHGTSPEMISMPGVYEIDVPVSRARNMNWVQ